jgi:hypothetical protein
MYCISIYSQLIVLNKKKKKQSGGIGIKLWYQPLPGAQSVRTLATIQRIQAPPTPTTSTRTVNFTNLKMTK